VFVGNLSYSVSEDTIKELFMSVGEVSEVQLISRFGRSKGYGFVSFQTQTLVDAAVQKFAGYELEGRPINCESAKEKKEKVNIWRFAGSSGGR
jgi:nucleolin